MQDSKRDTVLKNRLLDSVGEGEGVMIRENSSETCISASVKQMTSANSMHEAGHSKPVVWDDQRNGVAREVGGAFRMGGTHTPMAGSCQSMAKPPQ